MPDRPTLVIKWKSHFRQKISNNRLIERLSKKSKNGDCTKFAYNKINSLQAQNSQIWGFSTVLRIYKRPKNL